MAALVVLPQRFLYSMAVAGASVGLLSSLIALLVVPSLLALLGNRIDALSIRRGPAVSDESDGWYRLARGVMRRPVAVALASSALLLAAAAPLLWTTLTGPNSDFVPHGKPSYEANRTSKTTTRATSPRRSRSLSTARPSRAALASFDRRVEAIDGVVRGTPFARASGRSPTPTSPSTAGALPASPGRGRGDPRPRAAGRRDVLVSGNTAPSSTRSRASPTTCRCVIGIISADHAGPPLPTHRLGDPAVEDAADERDDAGRGFGIVVLAFQEGWLDGLFDYTGPAAVEVTSLVFLFAVIFGLATDYAVLVMARIKEQHDLGAATRRRWRPGSATPSDPGRDRLLVALAEVVLLFDPGHDKHCVVGGEAEEIAKRNTRLVTSTAAGPV